MHNLFIDITGDVLHLLDGMKKAFNSRLSNVPNELKLFENEIESTLSQRFDEVPPYLASFDNGISLREYFNIAWDCTENGTGEEIPGETLYLWGHEALAKIKEKYQGQRISKDYYVRLNKVAKEEYVTGAAYVRYHYWLKSELATFIGGNSNLLNQQPNTNVRQAKSKMLPTTFEEVFNNNELIEPCLQLLRATDPPTISDEKQFIGKSKGVLVIWLNALESKSMLSCSFNNDNERATLLNTNIKDLDISAGLFRAPNVRAKTIYESHFKTEIASIKQ